MKQVIFPILFFASLVCCGQSSNFRAQGNYYSAKTHIEAHEYSAALEYIYKSKENLGGTNFQLQYIHIVTAYNLSKYDEASKELQLFFDIEEGKIKPIPFGKEVERLTGDETKALTKLIDPILESAEKSHAAAEQRRLHPCQMCHGTGQVDKTERKFCDYCGNTSKYVPLKYPAGGGTRLTTEKKGFIAETCATCNGKGSEACTRCGGRGEYGPLSLVCPDCNKHREQTRKGLSFYCENCDGNGVTFEECEHCHGEKYYDITVKEKITCGDCGGKGY